MVTPYGIAITGNFDRVDGVAVDRFAYVSLETGKLIKRPVFQTYGNLPIPVAYDDATGYVYMHNRAFEKRRFSARTGEADEWLTRGVGASGLSAADAGLRIAPKRFLDIFKKVGLD